MKDARAEASNDFRECRLIFVAREAGQFNFRRLFVVARQKRASRKVSEPRAVATGSMRFCHET
jgi:hypothetical protein